MYLTGTQKWVTEVPRFHLTAMERLSIVLGVRFTSEKEFNTLGLIGKRIRDSVNCDDKVIIDV